MNPEEAQIVLGACPPGPWPDDAAVREALNVAAQDPKLAEWLRETRTFDTAISLRLRSLKPPAELKAAILAGHKVVKLLDVERMALQKESQRWGADKPNTWLQLSPMAWAALFLVCLGVGSFWLLGPMNIPVPVASSGASASSSSSSTASTPGTPLAAFRDEAAQYLSSEWDHTFDFPSTEFPKIQEWVSQQPNRMELEAPKGLRDFSTYGCKIFKQNGQTRTLVCFVPRGGGTVVHLVSVDRSELPADATDDLKVDGLQFARAGQWNSASWEAGSRVYSAYTQASPELLAQWVKN